MSLVAIAVGLGGCSAASSRPATAIPGGTQTVFGEGEEIPTQWLFRVQYRGPDGAGSLKLTLRWARAGRFQISTADALGRALWSLEQTPERVLFLDHREDLYCVLPPEVGLPEMALAPLPIGSIPRVLTYRLPVVPPVRDESASEGRIDFEDAGGRRWTAVTGDEGLESWTLWSDERPMLWWGRQDGGGILSHRDGAQFRWRQTVVEPLVDGLEPLEAPSSYRKGSCDGE